MAGGSDRLMEAAFVGGGTNRREGRDSACGALRLKRLKKRRQDVHSPTECLQAGRPPQWGYTHVL